MEKLEVGMLDMFNEDYRFTGPTRVWVGEVGDVVDDTGWLRRTTFSEENPECEKRMDRQTKRSRRGED